MTKEDRKRAAARSALEHVPAGCILGVGTGSTTNHFIDELVGIRDRIEGAVASSEASAARLRRIGIPLVELIDAGSFPLYVDGADEATPRRELIKGGGGALTREKILAAAAERFVCIVDDGKMVDRLGAFPLPVEVIPMARGVVAGEIGRIGGRAVLREEFETDNGNVVLDVHDLDIERPRELEEALNHLPGVVSNGLFCRRPADLVLVGGSRGVTRIE